MTGPLLVLALTAAAVRPADELPCSPPAGAACCAEGDATAVATELMACEADQIQFGMQCTTKDPGLLAMLAEAMACEADELTFGFRP